MKRAFLILLFVTGFYLFSFSQIEIWIDDGRRVDAKSFKVDTNYVFYTVNGKKVKALYKDEVFAIINRADTIFLVAEDSVNGIYKYDYLAYLRGLYDGFHQKNWSVLGISYLLGFSSSIVLPLIGFNGVFVVLPNLGYTSYLVLANRKSRLGIDDGLYNVGFNLGKNKRKIINSLEGGILGIASGSVLLYFVLKND